jgi:integrase
MSLQFRRYQRGSLYKRGTRIKKWYGMWREDIRLPDGSVERRQRNVCLGPMSELPTRSAAFGRLAECMGTKSEKPAMLTFEDLVEKWKEAVVPTLKTSTASYYLKILRSNLTPAFGKWSVSVIGRYDVECFLAKQAQTYTRNTLRGMRTSLSQVLAWGVSCDYLTKNPCASVKLPQAGTKVVRTVLTAQQVISISERLEEPYATLALFLAVTGTRIGEAIGIKWSDFDGDVLHVCRRVYEGQVGSTKTKGSNRHLPIPESLLARMKTLGSEGWVFSSREGTPINPGNALKRYIRPVAEKLGIPLGGWHDFRHTLTTGLLRDNVSAKVVSNILGHSDVKITLNTYCHTEVSDFREPLREMAAQLLPNVMKSEFQPESRID